MVKSSGAQAILPVRTGEIACPPPERDLQLKGLMATTKNEPQSYGSQADWVTGKTGATVNNPKSTPPSDDFYDSRRDSEGSAEDQGGKVSAQQHAESAQP